MEQLKIFTKNLIVMLLILMVAITSIGAISTKDVIFIVTGIVTLFVDAYCAYNYMNKNAGSKK